MGTRSLAAGVLLFAFATVAFAEEPDRELWITAGTDTVGAMQEALLSATGIAPTVVREQDGVAVFSVRESQVPVLSQVMHDRFNRCAGFLVHDSQEAALASLEDTAGAKAMGMTAVNYSIDNGPVVQTLTNGLQANKIFDTITSLASFTNRYYTAQTGVSAANWIKSLWEGYAQGRSDVRVELFPHPGWAQPSVIVTITGRTLPNEVVVIGGHLDSINASNTAGVAPGADDDASGVASFSEVIRMAMASNYHPARTVKFMAYAAEEVGLRGSKEIANAFRASAINVVGVLQLDMTNYHGSAVDVGLLTDNTNAAQNQFLTSVIDTYALASWSNTACGYGCSDHVSWTNAGYASSMPFESLMNDDNPFIHTPNDTLAQSGNSTDHALKFAKIAAAYMAELAKGDFTGGDVLTATYDAAMKSPRCATVGLSCDSGTLLNGRSGLGPEASAPNTLNNACPDGTAGLFHVDESNERLKISSVDNTPLAAGKVARIEATVWAFSATADKLDLYYAANANSPVWTFLTTLSPTTTGEQTLSATYTLPAGGLQAVRARFRYQGAASPCGTGAYDDHDDLVFAVGAAAPDTAAPTVSITAPAASSTVDGAVTITASASDNVGVTKVELYVDGTLKGTDTTAPYSFTWDTTEAPNASRALVVKAYDTVGNVGTSASVVVRVLNPNAVYDATLKAPRCPAGSNVCDSGTLLSGRAGMGPEVHAPNTINGSCADSASGTYRSDESNERIKVSTLDGMPFAAGKTVRVEATVWAYTSPSSDKLDLYSAPDANNPVWTLITTLTPATSGAQTLSATYKLPAGSLQAVRARFRYQGTASPCGTGSYDDHDDLIFPVR